MAWQYPVGKGTVKLVSTDWLMDQLGRDVKILDVQPNVHDYLQEHIPGALYMSEGLLRLALHGLPEQYVSAEAMQANLRRLGLRPEEPVVVYTGKGVFKGWGDGLEQTMVAYSLARFGMDNLYVLDGGLDNWKAEQRPLSQGYPRVEESSMTAQVRRDYFVDYEELKAIQDRDDVLLLDARPAKFYEGQGPWSKPGHIPGAINLPWASLMAEDNPAQLRSSEEIKSILDQHQVTPDKTIICSCGTGREATNEFLLFKWYLGYPQVKLYEGSFTEWVAYPDNPTVTGKNPR